MKKLFILLMLPFHVLVQNLVPNGSFEILSSCPSNGGQINLAVGWNQGNEGSSDLYHACNTSTLGAPNNSHGFQKPKESKGEFGLFNKAN